MQSIAAENNLAETAFFVKSGDRYGLRWMTPKVEVDLCGHATLASAFVIFNFLEPDRQSVAFDTRSGELIVRRDGDVLQLDFPARPPERCEPVRELSEALGAEPAELWAARDYMAVFGSEDEVRALQPDMNRLARLDRFAVIVTAPGKDVDFVSRFFAPSQGIPEDPVTGSAHCTLIPYWSRRLGRTRLNARQVSERGGELLCEDAGARVFIAGRAALFLEGKVHV
jgi:PhzF family phenazine biosynthesis protein